MRRCISGSKVGLVAAMSAAAQQTRNYRVIPHIDWEIEELAETQQAGRWQIAQKGSYQAPETKGERMTQLLNRREARRRGVLPEKSIIRKVSDTYAVDGEVYENPAAYTAKIIEFTIVGFDGHPFHFKTPIMPDMTLNTLIDGSGMCHGAKGFWLKCMNDDCTDPMHADGCLVNIDLETLYNLPPPCRMEYQHLLSHRIGGARADITHTTRHSCQIRICEELDGGLIALKQVDAPKLLDTTLDWGHYDDLATISYHRCRQIEPFAPMMEEPTQQDFPVTLGMFWEDDWEEVMKHKYPDYRRKDGFHTKPTFWSEYI